MNLEEIKCNAGVSFDKRQRYVINWLIAEVERLQKDLPVLMLLNEYGDIKKAIATRCAEIVLEVANTQQGKSGYPEGWRDCGDQIAMQIGREFLEEK